MTLWRASTWESELISDMSGLIIKYRWLIISMCIAGGLFFIILIPSARTDPDMRNYIPRDMPSVMSTDSIEEIFGFQDMLLVLYSDSAGLTREGLRILKETEKGLSEIRGISSIISPFSIRTIRSEDGMMVAERLVDRVPANDEETAELKNKIQLNRYAGDVVFSPDLKTSVMTLTLSEKTTETKILSGIDSVLAATGQGNKFSEAGLPAVRSYIVKDVRKDAVKIVPAALLIMLLVLRISLGSWKNVFTPFTVVVLATGISIGLIPLLGWKISIISLLVPVILIAVANNYGIYLASLYRKINEKHNGSAHATISELLKTQKTPILYSGLTTIAGLLGLVTHSIIPARQVGILASAGVALALILSLFLVPAILSVNNQKKSNTGKKIPGPERLSERFWTRLSGIIIKHPGKILIITCAVILVFSAGIFKIRTDTNQEHFFSESHPLRKASEIINRNFGGSQTISVMISGDIKDPQVMKGIDRLTTRLEAEKGAGKVFSIASAVREMTKALYGKDEEGYNSIPGSREAIAQLFELYYMSGDSEDFKQLLNPESDKAHILIRLSDPDREVIRRIKGVISETSGEIPARVTTGGYALIMADFTGSLVKGQVFSLAFALVTVFILLSIVFRSVRGGLTGSIPLAASIIILFGFMGYTGIAIDPATALLSSVMIGVGVDFTIQYIWRLKLELAAGNDMKTATGRAMSSIGHSIMTNALTVMAGFSALIVSGFTSIRFFGYLVVISIASCLAGALLTIPAFIVKYNPAFVRKNIDNLKTDKNEDEADTSVIVHSGGKSVGPAA